MKRSKKSVIYSTLGSIFAVAGLIVACLISWKAVLCYMAFGVVSACFNISSIVDIMKTNCTSLQEIPGDNKSKVARLVDDLNKFLKELDYEERVQLVPTNEQTLLDLQEDTEAITVIPVPEPEAVPDTVEAVPPVKKNRKVVRKPKKKNTTIE